ncbi:MAG TPA: hypothetical protein VN247_06990 [Arenimonas sp.]|nr:hypothetical protein [Arenimonas sp.]
MYNSNANKSISTTDANTNQVHLNDRYRPRNLGIGYGKSSGYASVRKYASTSNISLVRVR